MANNIVADIVDTQQQIGNTDTTIPLFSLFSESLACSYVSASVVRQNIGHAFTVGHATNGKIGTANGVDGSQITIGTGGLGSSTLHYSYP